MTADPTPQDCPAHPCYINGHGPLSANPIVMGDHALFHCQKCGEVFEEIIPTDLDQTGQP